jgi:hypothetical protein
MGHSTKTATLLIGMTLLVGVLHAVLDRAMADPATGAAPTPKSRPAVPAKGALQNASAHKISAVLAQAVHPAAAAPSARQRPPGSRGRAYLFRGALGPIFSRGVDRLTERIERAGIQARVDEFTLCPLVAATAIREYHEDPAPITLIGHSMGGLCALKFAEMLQAKDIPVALVVTLDPARASPNVPLNVERYINIFLSSNILGGANVEPKQGYRGYYASFDLSEQDNITHINIDKKDFIHEQLVAKILRLGTQPTKTEGKAPLRFVVPANATIELWDGGTPVFARAGDTLQTLATSYHVPLWSLTQINKISDYATLAPSQRVIIPRHLVPHAPDPRQRPPRR